MTNKQKATLVEKALQARFPEEECGLCWCGEPFRLLIMAILSAQCTDLRVNIVSEGLFRKYPDAKALANADIASVEAEIRSLGFYRAKAKAITECAKRICEVYGGAVPSDMDELLTLRGVGRKVANLVRGDIYGLGGIVADTHCMRISERLGFVNERNPQKTEQALSKLLPLDRQSAFCHRLVLFGREVCTARSPKCRECEMKDFCKYGCKI